MLFEVSTFRHVLTSFLVSILTTIIFLTFINNKKLKKILFWFFIPIFTIQTIAMVTINWDVGYQFIINLFDNTAIKAAFSIYLKYSIVGILFFVLVYFVIYKLITSFNIKNNYIRLPFLVISFIYLICPYSSVFRFFSIFTKYFNNPYYSLKQEELFKEISGKDFVDKTSIETNIHGKPKNLVIIFLESVELAMLENEPFNELSKDILNLAKEGEFFTNIRQTEGSGWTMGGIHTVLCGNIFAYHSSRTFKHANISNLVCLSDLLKTSGYYLVNMGGDNKRFAGREMFMKLHGYDEIFGWKEIKNIMNISDSLVEGWGIKDIDSFNFLKQKFIELSKNSDRPFHILTNTLDIHGPNGEYDPRCPDITGNSTLNILKCTNDNLLDFIKFLKQQPNYKDTIIVILPDHLYMSGNISKYLDKIKDRRLYAILLNSGKTTIYDDEILYVDLASIILDRLGIKHNVNFLLTNNQSLTTKERVDFIKNNFDKIKAFNNKTVLQEE